MVPQNNEEMKQISRSVQQGTHDCVSKQKHSPQNGEAGTVYKGDYIAQTSKDWGKTRLT